jgi:hypothetical protein
MTDACPSALQSVQVRRVRRRAGKMTDAEKDAEVRKFQWDMHIECARTLVLVNGASAVGLLTFLQANWTTAQKFAPWILVGMLVFAVGVLMSTKIYGQLAAESSSAQAPGATDAAEYAKAHKRSAHLSWFCFAAGCGIVGVGMVLAARGLI